MTRWSLHKEGASYAANGPPFVSQLLPPAPGNVLLGFGPLAGMNGARVCYSWVKGTARFVPRDEKEGSGRENVHLQTGDLPIIWRDAREYNPDLIAIDRDDTHWLIEVKMDKEMASLDVQAKRDAARRWANHVNADEKVHTTWRYLLVSETDVKTAKGSWVALSGLGGSQAHRT
jgi:hypothetical protein